MWPRFFVSTLADNIGFLLNGICATWKARCPWVSFTRKMDQMNVLDSDADWAGEIDDCNQRQGICSRSVVQWSVGEARNKHVWILWPWKLSTRHWQQSKRSFVDAKVADRSKTILHENQPGALKTTNQPFVWPRIHSSKGEPSALASSITSFGNKWGKRLWNCSTVLLRKLLLTCLPKVWAETGS